MNSVSPNFNSEVKGARLRVMTSDGYIWTSHKYDVYMLTYLSGLFSDANKWTWAFVPG